MYLSEIIINHKHSLSIDQRNLLLDLMERGVEDHTDIPVRTAVLSDDIYEISTDELFDTLPRIEQYDDFITGSKVEICRILNDVLDKTFKHSPSIKAGTTLIKYCGSNSWYIEPTSIPSDWEEGSVNAEWVTKYLTNGKEVNKKAVTMLKELGVI